MRKRQRDGWIYSNALAKSFIARSTQNQLLINQKDGKNERKKDMG